MAAFALPQQTPFDGGLPMTKFAAVCLASLAAVWLLTARPGETRNLDKANLAGPTKAICVVQPLSDSKVSGVVTFTQKGDEITITGQISGLTPGLHGFHVHEFGDVSSKDGLSAGGHFNPDGMKHGGPHDKDRHVGDLGNIQADANGIATLNIKDKVIQLDGPHSIIGRGLIVHAKADDEKTQPTGDAGGRVGGGVIGIANDAPPKK
jgi:superoxide dismutase, Cu-Zn family